MVDRRHFIKHTVAAAAIVPATRLIAADLPRPATLNQSARGRRIDFVLFDEELEDSVAFARELMAVGSRAFAVQQDLGRLWFGEMGQAFRPGASIAGLTAHSELMICANFARQQGALVRFESEHDCRGCDVITHKVNTSLAESHAASLLAARDRWPNAMAMLIRDAPLSTNSNRSRIATTTARSATHPGSLFAWLIA